MGLYKILISLCLFVNLCHFIKCHSIETINWQLYFPRYTVLQFSFALVVPLDMPVKSRRGNMNFGIQCNYDLPWNSTWFYRPMYYDLRERSFNEEVQKNVTIAANENSETKESNSQRIKRDLSAGEFYTSIEDVFELFGYHSECLQKSICELAKVPLNPNSKFNGTEAFHDDEDIFHQMIHFLLTPSVHQSFDTENEVDKRIVYETAEQTGRANGACDVVYANCLKSPLEMVTHSIEEFDDWHE